MLCPDDSLMISGLLKNTLNNKVHNARCRTKSLYIRPLCEGRKKCYNLGITFMMRLRKGGGQEGRKRTEVCPITSTGHLSYMQRVDSTSQCVCADGVRVQWPVCCMGLQCGPYTDGRMCWPPATVIGAGTHG